MAMINLTNTGNRRSMTDATRWRSKAVAAETSEPVSRPEPASAPVTVHEADPAEIIDGPAPVVATGIDTQAERDNIDRSLRDRIRRISRRPQREEAEHAPAAEKRPRRVRNADEERAELSDEAFSFKPAGPKGRDTNERPAPVRDASTLRQSARRREDTPQQTQVPARRATSEPEVHTTSVQASENEVDMLRSEIEELRREMSEMRESIARISQPTAGPKGLGAVERTMQRLAERMDRIDGGAQPQISNGIAGPRPRKKGFFASLFN